MNKKEAIEMCREMRDEKQNCVAVQHDLECSKRLQQEVAALDVLIAEAEQASEWQPINRPDDLPTRKGFYWATSSMGNVFSAAFDVVSAANFWLGAYVAWQPLPAAYLTEDNNV
jgi:hypothetical protein